MADAVLVGIRRYRADSGDQRSRHQIERLGPEIFREIIRIVNGHGVYHGRQNRHRMGGRREPVEEPQHFLVNHGVLRQPLGKKLLLLPIGKLPVDEQIGHLGKACFFGEFLDGYSAVSQNSLVSVDVRDGGDAGTCVLIADVQRNQTRILPQPGDIDSLFVFRSFNDRQLVFHSIERQRCFFHGILHLSQALKYPAVLRGFFT